MEASAEGQEAGIHYAVLKCLPFSMKFGIVIPMIHGHNHVVEQTQAVWINAGLRVRLCNTLCRRIGKFATHRFWFVRRGRRRWNRAITVCRTPVNTHRMRHMHDHTGIIAVGDIHSLAVAGIVVRVQIPAGFPLRRCQAQTSPELADIADV